jgi:hypothetical protein
MNALDQGSIPCATKLLGEGPLMTEKLNGPKLPEHLQGFNQIDNEIIPIVVLMKCGKCGRLFKRSVYRYFDCGDTDCDSQDMRCGPDGEAFAINSKGQDIDYDSEDCDDENYNTCSGVGVVVGWKEEHCNGDAP